jgi:hypothetical protein
MGLHPLVPPRFPTLSELAAPPIASPASSPRRGLFVSLVGDPTVMFDDLLRSPEKYEEGVSDLLLGMVTGRRSLKDLSPEEMEVLDRATVDLNRKTSSSKPDSSPEKSLATAPQQTSSEDSELQKEAAEAKEAKAEERAEAMPADLVPDEEMIPFWFR